MRRPWRLGRRSCRDRPTPKTLLGTACLIGALLITIVCVPSWVAALVIAGALIVLAARLLIC